MTIEVTFAIHSADDRRDLDDPETQVAFAHEPERLDDLVVREDDLDVVGLEPQPDGEPGDDRPAPGAQEVVLGVQARQPSGAGRRHRAPDRTAGHVRSGSLCGRCGLGLSRRLGTAHEQAAAALGIEQLQVLGVEPQLERLSLLGLAGTLQPRDHLNPLVS